jgi:hypothetical protein
MERRGLRARPAAAPESPAAEIAMLVHAAHSSDAEVP